MGGESGPEMHSLSVSEYLLCRFQPWQGESNVVLLSSKGQGIVTLAFEVTKQDGSVVQEGETTLLTRRRPGA